MINLDFLNLPKQVLDAVKTVIDKFVVDPTKKAEAELEMFKSLVEIDKAQANINAIEAGSDNIFKSGWRPALGWVMTLSCAWNWALLPICLFVSDLFGIKIKVEPASLSEMWPVLFGMLGLYGIRAWEKKQ